MSAFTPTNKPKPILEFHNIRSDRAPSSQPVQPPRDLRWLRVEEFFHARTIAPNTKKAYERELKRFVGWTDKAWNDITGRDIASYKHYLSLFCYYEGSKIKKTSNLPQNTLQEKRENHS